MYRSSRVALALAVGAASAWALAAWGATPASAATGNLFASVSSNGTLLTGGGATGVKHLGTGRYEVTFGVNVAGCAYVATPVSASVPALQVFTAGGHLSADGVYVETKNLGWGLTDGSFNLVVDCGQPGWYYAVVGYNANLVRSSGRVTLTNRGYGRYYVSFPAVIAGCAYLATVGDPGNSIKVDPDAVFTGSGPNGSTVYIETKNEGGGLMSGIPFHLGVICPTAVSTTTAVVNATGIINRGSPLTSSFSPAAGHYTLVTTSSVGKCATVATRGSVDTQVPEAPTNVQITPGPAFNTVGVQLTGLFAPGTSTFYDESFHAAVVC